MKNLLILTVLVVFLASCGANNESKPKDDETGKVTVKNLYSLVIPPSLREATNLNEEASMQYQNPVKELYIITIDEPVSGFDKAIDDAELAETYSKDLVGYSNFVIDNLMSAGVPKKNAVTIDQKINGLDAKICEIESNVGGYDIFYKIALIKGKENYYQVMTWTLLTRKEEHKAEMEAMLWSFKEI